jgi:hypothetical protein
VPSQYVVDFPTLWVGLDWVENHCVIPDTFERGKPFVLSDWQAWALANHYRIKPDAPLPDAHRGAIGAAAFHYRRSQIVLPQKSGKGPHAAAQVLLEGCGPTMFTGWATGGQEYRCAEHGCHCGWVYSYRAGEPMAVPRPTALIQLTAYSYEQVGNVYDALRPMIEFGPLSEVIPATGEAFTRLPGGGRIDVVTSSQRSRLGQRVTFVVQDECGIWLPQNKMDEVAKTQRRGVAGMNGRLIEPLALDTLVPTPAGWSTVGDLTVGDLVFDSSGLPTPVVGVTPVLYDRGCYEVIFDDGERIVASAEHGWTVEVRHRKKAESTIREIATAEARELLGCYSLSIPVIAINGLVEVDLPVDPYFLGLWLGDGDRRDSSVCCAPPVAEHLIANIEAGLLWYEELIVQRSDTVMVMRPRRRHRICRQGHDWSEDEMGNGTLRSGRRSVTCGACQRAGGRGEATLLTMRERLRVIGVLGYKHVPPLYLRASRDQRLRLLRGLMDSDGTVTTIGQALFSNTDRDLVTGVTDLVASLGFKPKVYRHDYPHRGRPAYSVSFWPGAEDGIVTLEHKASRLRSRQDLDRRIGRRYITDIVPVTSMPVRCVGVATDDHLFLAGRRGVLTHNTTNAWEPSENSVAQQTADAALKVEDIFRLHPLAPPGLSFMNKAERRRILRHVYAGCPWVDLDTIDAEAAELITNDPGNAERFFGNRLVAGLGAWMVEKRWNAARKPSEVTDGATLALGFDGSESDDWTAIRAETQDGYQFTPTYGPDRRPTWWDPSQWGGSIPRGEVDAAVAELGQRYQIRRMYADPRDWRSEIGEWMLRHGEEVVFEWDTYVISRMFPALHRFRIDAIEKRITHDGDPIVAQHVLNARKAAKPGDKYLLVKPDRHRKIDLAMASVLAHEAAADLHAAAAWAPPSAVRWAVGRTWVQ